MDAMGQDLKAGMHPQLVVTVIGGGAYTLHKFKHKQTYIS